MSVPLTVVSGYLGAGKTTLINRLLAADHGLRLMVLVNDFGAIDVDAGLLASADEDTIALTNGCVCCTMGADLFLALGDALDRRPRPDHLVVEASGISDPARIAAAALAEPDLRPAGIVTVVARDSHAALAGDPLIAPQVLRQIEVADLVHLSRPGPEPDLSAVTQAAMTIGASDVTSLLFLDPSAPRPPGPDHAAHTEWSYDGPARLSAPALSAALRARPSGLFRVKGSLADEAGRVWEVQAVGATIAVTPSPASTPMGLVGIGLAERLNMAEVDAWWQTVLG